MAVYASGKSNGKAERTGGRATRRTGCGCLLGDLAWDNFTVHLVNWEDCTPNGPCSVSGGGNPFVEVQRNLLWTPPPGNYVLPYIGPLSAPGLPGCLFGLFNQSGEECGKAIESPTCDAQSACLDSICEYGADMIVLEVRFQDNANPSFRRYDFSLGIALPIFGTGPIYQSEVGFPLLNSRMIAGCNFNPTCGCFYTIPSPAYVSQFSIFRNDLIAQQEVFRGSLSSIPFCPSEGVLNVNWPSSFLKVQRRSAYPYSQPPADNNIIITQGP